MEASAFMTKDETAASIVSEAAESSGDYAWRLPLWDDYLVEMKGGETADLVNSSMRSEGAACSAAAFLEHFARGLKWAHLDIASTAWTYETQPESAKGANAFGARLLVKWLEGEGVANIEALNKVLAKGAKPWWSAYGGKENIEVA
jgi:leucyl aminopeptidase